nr:MAG TPA: hypothetical protein [Caudoviricetes sp.]
MSSPILDKSKVFTKSIYTMNASFRYRTPSREISTFRYFICNFSK